MIGEVLVWGSKWYFVLLELWNLMFQVLSLKFKTPKSNCGNEEIKGHLALRLNDTCILKERDLVDLLNYVHEIFRIKYLTVISGNLGFQRELEFDALACKGKIFYNYQLARDTDETDFHVNLVDCDSENLFLLKLKEESMANETVENIFSIAFKSFTSKLNCKQLFM